jgi:hypothetical protein
MAQVYRKVGDLENYAKNLNNALENKLSLTYSSAAVRKELEMVLKKESLEVDEMEEFSADEDFEDDEYFDEEENEEF